MCSMFIASLELDWIEKTINIIVISSVKTKRINSSTQKVKLSLYSIAISEQ